VRRRLHRYLLSDRGRAIEKAREAAGVAGCCGAGRRADERRSQGIVLVPTTARGHLEDLVVRLADASRAVHEAVVVLLE
jgi:hypothetical protein